MQQADQGPGGGPPPPMKVVYYNNTPAPAMISQTTTVQTTRNNCCFYYLLVVQVIIMIMFGITMGGLTPVSPDKGAQTAFKSIYGFAWQKILYLDVYDDGISDDISDDKVMTSMSFYAAFNFVQAAFGIGQTGTNPNGASDPMIYALADYSGTGCSMTYDQDIQVGSDGDPLKEIN